MEGRSEVFRPTSEGGRGLGRWPSEAGAYTTQLSRSLIAMEVLMLAAMSARNQPIAAQLQEVLLSLPLRLELALAFILEFMTAGQTKGSDLHGDCRLGIG
jgi:hypothetical protein